MLELPEIDQKMFEKVLPLSMHPSLHIVTIYSACRLNTLFSVQLHAPSNPTLSRHIFHAGVESCACHLVCPVQPGALPAVGRELFAGATFGAPIVR